ARGAERLARVGRAVVEVEDLGRMPPSERLDDEREHLVLSLVRGGLDRDDVSALVVEDGVDAERDRAALDRERWAMAHVGVPDRVDARRLPAPPAGIVR